MEYRQLGRSGLRVSALGFGAWLTFGDQLDDDGALACCKRPRCRREFFDNAEVYGDGEAERIMGACSSAPVGGAATS